MKKNEIYLKPHLTAILVFLSLFFFTPAQAEKWETTKFTIIQEAPVVGTLGDKIIAQAATKVTNLRFSTLDKNLLTQLEDYLEKVAIKYEALGFMSPSLPIKGSKFVINTYDYDDKDIQAFFTTFYTTPVSYALLLDRSRITTTKLGVQLTPKIWEDLAHELFHAVQASYPLVKTNQKLGDWIMEATADAMGIEMANKYKSLAIGVMPRWGGRSYSRPLRVKDDNRDRKDDGYWSSSLWRYIGEYISNGRSVVGSKKAKDPDYRYLVKLFEQKINGTTNEGKELDWLDKGLRGNSKIGVGLNNIYSKFVTTFSHYVPDRFGTEANAWRNCLYGKDVKCRNLNSNIASEVCDTVTLQKGSSQEVELSLSKAASNCVEVSISGAVKNGSFPVTQVRFYVEGNDKKQLESLWIGTKHEDRTQGRFESKKGESPVHNRIGGDDFVSWIYTLSTNPQIFTVSNVASKPSETNTQKFTIIAAYPHSETDLNEPPGNGGN